MGKTRVQEYGERFSEQTIRINPYAIKKMGLLQSQTLLKLEDYMLICAPFQLSMKQAVLLGILSREEVAFFQQFQGKMASLSFTFQRAGTKAPINLFIRGILDRMGPVKGRNNVCLMDLSFRNCPNDLAEIIGEYLSAYEALRNQYGNFRGHLVEMNEENARIMRYNNYAETQVGDRKVLSRLASIGVDTVELDLPMPAGGIAQGAKLSSRLYFQTYQFNAAGPVAEVRELEPETTRVRCEVEFTPELVEIIDDYFFRLRFKK